MAAALQASCSYENVTAAPERTRENENKQRCCQQAGKRGSAAEPCLRGPVQRWERQRAQNRRGERGDDTAAPAPHCSRSVPPAQSRSRRAARLCLLGKTSPQPDCYPETSWGLGTRPGQRPEGPGNSVLLQRGEKEETGSPGLHRGPSTHPRRVFRSPRRSPFPPPAVRPGRPARPGASPRAGPAGSCFATAPGHNHRPARGRDTGPAAPRPAAARPGAAPPPGGRRRCRQRSGAAPDPEAEVGGGRRRRVGPVGQRDSPVLRGLARRRSMAEAAAAAEAGQGPAQGDAELAAVIGATVPTGFELTAAEEVQEKLGSASRISRDRGKIYFEVAARSLPQVRPLPAWLPARRRAGRRCPPRHRPVLAAGWPRRWLTPRWSAPRRGLLPVKGARCKDTRAFCGGSRSCVRAPRVCRGGGGQRAGGEAGAFPLAAGRSNSPCNPDRGRRRLLNRAAR